MFKKKATYKSASAINGKLRKQLAAHLTATCKHCWSTEPEALKEKLALLLPVNLESCSAITAKGDKLAVYSFAKQPRYLQLERTGSSMLLVPTLYTLIHEPAILPVVLVPSQVLAFLQSGADLMIRGIMAFPEVEAGMPVSIGCRRADGRIVLVGVGVAAISKSFFKVSASTTGKGVLMVSCVGDTLHPDLIFAESTTALPVLASLGDCVDSIGNQKDGQDSEISIEPLNEWQDLSRTVEESTSFPATSETPASHSAATPVKADNRPVLSTDATDHAFEQALLYGFYEIQEEAVSTSLPMSLSAFMERHILPYLLHDEDFQPPQMKQSSWKKTSKFFSKQKEKLKCKEQNGQTIITEIFWNTPDLQSFVPYRLPAHELDEVVKPAKPAPKTLDIQILYTLPPKLAGLALFERSHQLTESQVADLLERYYTHEKLHVSKKLITINAELAELLAPSNHNQATLSSKILLQQCLSLASPSYRIGETGALRRGAPPQIKIVEGARKSSAGRIVTLLTALEAFFTEDQVEALAEQLRKRCAGATAVRAGFKAGSVEIQLQGPWATTAKAIVLEAGVPAAYVMVEVSAKKKR